MFHLLVPTEKGDSLVAFAARLFAGGDAFVVSIYILNLPAEVGVRPTLAHPGVL